MKVETYEAQEVSAEHPECTDEARNLMESLGLSGQLRLVSEPEPGQSAAPFPYRKMTMEEGVVYGLLCPAMTDLKNYAETQVPLRVLQVAAHAREHFRSLMVLHPLGIEKDPVLIGCKGETYQRDQWFILARWGEELDEWPVLVKKAAAKYMDRLVSDVDSGLAKLTMLREAIKSGLPESFMFRHDAREVTVYGPGL